MTLQELYTAIDVDYDMVISRLRKEERILKYLRQAMTDPAFTQLTQAMQAQDYEELFRAAHTIKGMCLNLDMKPLADAAILLVEQLRQGKTENAQQLYQTLMQQYDRMQQLIAQLEIG